MRSARAPGGQAPAHLPQDARCLGGPYLHDVAREDCGVAINLAEVVAMARALLGKAKLAKACARAAGSTAATRTLSPKDGPASLA